MSPSSRASRTCPANRLQFAITWLSVRSSTVSGLVKAEPTLLFYQDQFLTGPMRRSRVVEAEVRAAVREQGVAAMTQVEAVVLETDGTFAVVNQGSGEATALAGLIPKG